MRIKLLRIIYNLFLLTIILNIEILNAQEIYDKGFADYLFKEKEYYRAITEYYRILYNHTDSTQKSKILRNIGLCYFHGADYE